MKLAVYTVSLPEYDLEQSVSVLKEMGYEASSGAWTRPKVSPP